MTVGLPLFRVGDHPTSDSSSTGSISERFVGLTAARRRILEALTDPENAASGPEAICRVAGVARSTYWTARRDPEFLAVLAEVREALYPGRKVELAERIFADAVTPLREAFRRDGERIVSFAAEVVRTREQAAAFLGLTIEAPKVQVIATKTETAIRRFEGYPEAAVKEWAETGHWDRARWGPPPWQKA